jgi:hypothetical protein
MQGGQAAHPDLASAAFAVLKDWLFVRRKAWLRNLWPRMVRRITIARRAPMAVVRWMLGVPEAQWTTLHDITETTTDLDMERRLYRANYTFTHHHHHNRGMFANPMSLLDVHNVGNKFWLVVQYFWNGALQTLHLPIEVITKIRFHSRLQA